MKDPMEYEMDARQDEENARLEAEENKRLEAAEPEGECIPEFIDGTYYGCGVCEPCRDQEDTRQREAEERGNPLEFGYAYTG
ncbi:hypothetical protein [Streptomyces sp. NBC_00470]|uniref:hypothetical protein n=1 Tax=Streptomyces sp. NBC_00470 TaxID=2975753 RepID=UPI0030E42A09